MDAQPDAVKRVFLRPLHPKAQSLLSRPILDPCYRHGATKIMLPAKHMIALPDFFADIPDPRRAQGRRHPLPAVLAISVAAVLCGMRGYKAISQWAQDLSRQALARFLWGSDRFGTGGREGNFGRNSSTARVWG